MKTAIPGSSPSSRRRFLSQFAAGAAAIALALRGRGQAATAPRKLGIAIVGLGSYARGQIGPALKLTEHCRLAGVVTGSHSKGLDWAKEYGFPETSIYNYETMGRIADNPDIDIVYVITPNALHAGHVIAAAHAGKHVISEKPFTTNVADAERAIAACRQAKVKLSIGYRLHFDPFHQEMMRLAADPNFGPFVKMTGANGFYMGKKVWRAERPLSGGGPLMDMGIYCLQEACMAAGAPPVAVTAREHPKTRPEFFTDVEEGLDWTMEFASGARAELTTSYSKNEGFFRAEGTKEWYALKPAYSYRGLHATSSRGPVDITGLRSQQAVQLDDFALCVQEDRPTRVPGEMGLRDMKIIAAIYEAARSGKRVAVNI